MINTGFLILTLISDIYKLISLRRTFTRSKHQMKNIENQIPY